MKKLFSFLSFLFLIVLPLTAQLESDCLLLQGRSETSDSERWVTKAVRLTERYDKTTTSDIQWQIEGSLSFLENGYYFLNLDIYLTTSDALLMMAYIEQSTPLQLTFLDNSQIQLYTLSLSRDRSQPSSDKRMYSLNYILPKKAVKYLQTKELDQLKLSWQKDELVFEIYDVDFFKRHFACLQKNL